MSTTNDSNKQRRLADHLEQIRPKEALHWEDEQEKKLDWGGESHQPANHQQRENLK